MSTYVYIRSEPQLWTVGVWRDRLWEPESDHGSPEAAAERVHYLNGGGTVAAIMQEVSDTPPWAYTYRERPDDLIEIRASELEAILTAHLAKHKGR
jgi:hypothetical protein